jgi:hypothetical protein
MAISWKKSLLLSLANFSLLVIPQRLTAQTPSETKTEIDPKAIDIY